MVRFYGIVRDIKIFFDIIKKSANCVDTHIYGLYNGATNRIRTGDLVLTKETQYPDFTGIVDKLRSKYAH